MSTGLLVAVLVALVAFGHLFGRHRAMVATTGGAGKLSSLPGYYGLYVALWCGIPALVVLVVWWAAGPAVIEQALLGGLAETLQGVSAARRGLLLNDIHNIADGLAAGRSPRPDLLAAAARLNHLRGIGDGLLFVTAMAAAIAGLVYARSRIRPDFRARAAVERVFNFVLIACSLLAILVTIGIVLSLLFEAVRFFAKISPLEFLFGLQWSPQTALRADQVGSEGAFGSVPLFAGTLLITAIAMAVAVPIGLLSAVYMAEYAPRRLRDVIKPMLEILAGIPTVVYGFFAALTVAPLVRGAGAGLGLDVASESALAAGLVMGIMIIPFISSISDDVIHAVPQTLRDAAFALGATQSETIKQVILPAALPGIVGGVLLAVSRAIGETMIVVMAAGLAANLTANPLQAVTTVTVQIVTLLVGDQEFDSAKTLAAFALGLTLFCVTLVLNVIALRTVRKYREKYD